MAPCVNQYERQYDPQSVYAPTDHISGMNAWGIYYTMVMKCIYLYCIMYEVVLYYVYTCIANVYILVWNIFTLLEKYRSQCLLFSSGLTTAVISFYQGKEKHSCHRESYTQIKIKLSWSFGGRFMVFSLRWSTWEMPRKHTAHRTRRVHIGKYISIIFSMASKEVTKPAGQNGSWEKRGLLCEPVDPITCAFEST